MNMTDRYLLYVDILGFSNLVSKSKTSVNDLYEVIASLNAHTHSSFRAVVFSDTILVYNAIDAASEHDRNYIIMFLCEFAQDLMHRLVERDIVFRAVIDYGEFVHYELNSIPCFYGTALIEAYKNEKAIQAIGLFITKELDKDNNIFSSRPYSKKYNFVYVTQSLQRVEREHQGNFPAKAWLFEETDEIWHIVPEVLMMKHIYLNANSDIEKSIKRKYQATWKFYEKEYPKTLNFLVANTFDVSKMSPKADFNKVLKRYPEDYSWAVETRREY